MADFEAGPTPRDLEVAYTMNSIMNDSGLRYRDVNAMVDEALAGQESYARLIEGSFQGMHQYHSNRAMLDSYFGGAWSVIDRDGRNFSGIPEQSLRNSEGQITNSQFAEEVATHGVANVISERRAGSAGPVSVNNIWRLTKAADGTYLPWAKVRTIDADASSVARPVGPNVRPRDVMISEKVVVFAGVTLPTAQ